MVNNSTNINKTSDHLSPLTHWTPKGPRNMIMEIHILVSDRHKNETGLNWLLGSNPPLPFWYLDLQRYMYIYLCAKLEITYQSTCLYTKSPNGNNYSFICTIFFFKLCNGRVVSSNPVHGEVYSIQHYVIKFVRDLQQVDGFLRVLRFPPPINLTATI
jgi:hypothetical protein